MSHQIAYFRTQGYAPLLNDWENFFTRRMYHRAQDCFNRPITGPPGANRMQVAERVSYDGNFSLRCVKLGMVRVCPSAQSLLPHEAQAKWQVPPLHQSWQL